MGVSQHIEGYLEDRVEEIDETLSSWFGVENYRDSLPNIDLGGYETASYDEENDLIGVSTDYLSEKSILELDTTLAEEVAHRIHKSLNPEASNDQSEFFGRLGERVYKQAYELEVEEFGLDTVEEFLEEKRELEKRAKEQDRNKNQPSDKAPDKQEYEQEVDQIVSELQDDNYKKAKELSKSLAEKVKYVDEDLVYVTLNDDIPMYIDFLGAREQISSREEIIDKLKNSKSSYRDVYENQTALEDINLNQAKVDLQLENMRQHLPYAFADQIFEHIENMPPEQRSELISSPGTLWDKVFAEDEEFMEFLEENEEILGQNIHF